MERRASPEESSVVVDKSSEKRSPTCFWKSSRSSISWSWVPSMDMTWFLRMLIRPRNEPWFSVVAGIFCFWSGRGVNEENTMMRK